MPEENDDFELVEMWLLNLPNGRSDIFELYRLKENDGSDYVYGIYSIKKGHYIIGRADNEKQLSKNLSIIAIFNEMGLHNTRFKSIEIFNRRFLFN